VLIMRSCVLFMTLLPALASAGVAERTALDDGYRQMYNRDFDAAHQSFQLWEGSHPEDPMGPVSDAAAYLFSEFDRMHILEAEYFVDDKRVVESRPAVPDARLKQNFDDALASSQKLAERILSRSAQDETATFATILRLGLHADYLALIEKRYFPSLSEMKTSRILAEQLVARDPGYYDAYLAIGIENYLLSLKPAPVRLLLRMGGAQTDKEQGIQKLRLTAEKGRYLLPYARLLLAVAALRDKDRNTARAILQGLADEFPRNPLYAKQLARLTQQ
jgi:hypothetical protein